jgi:hypothetical protein
MGNQLCHHNGLLYRLDQVIFTVFLIFYDAAAVSVRFFGFENPCLIPLASDSEYGIELEL